MASIAINEIKFAGADLLVDSESFLNDLEDRDLTAAVGGVTPVVTFTAVKLGTVSVWGTTFGTGFAIGTFGVGGGLGFWASRRR